MWCIGSLGAAPASSGDRLILPPPRPLKAFTQRRASRSLQDLRALESCTCQATVLYRVAHEALPHAACAGRLVVVSIHRVKTSFASRYATTRSFDLSRVPPPSDLDWGCSDAGGGDGRGISQSVAPAKPSSSEIPFRVRSDRRKHHLAELSVRCGFFDAIAAIIRLSRRFDSRSLPGQ